MGNITCSICEHPIVDNSNHSTSTELKSKYDYATDSTNYFDKIINYHTECPDFDDISMEDCYQCQDYTKHINGECVRH